MSLHPQTLQFSQIVFLRQKSVLNFAGLMETQKVEILHQLDGARIPFANQLGAGSNLEGVQQWQHDISDPLGQVHRLLRQAPCIWGIASGNTRLKIHS